MSSRHRSRLLNACVVALIAIAALGLAACGGSSDSDSSGTEASSTEASGGSTEAGGGSSDNVAYAEAQLEKGMEIPQFTLKAPAVDAAKAEGKTVFNIPLRSGDSYVDATAQQMAKVAEQYGLKFINYENQGTPTEWAKGIEQAITEKADAIVLMDGPEATLLLPQLKQAKAAGIPVLIHHLYPNGTPIPDEIAPYIAAQITTPFEEGARLEADYAIADSDENANVLVVSSNVIAPSRGIVEDIEDELSTRCSNCKVSTLDVPPTEWATKITPGVQTALTNDPTINYVIPIFDSMSLGVAPAIQASAKTGKVKIISFNGTPAVLKLIQEGETMAMDVGEDVRWLGYAAMDQVFRVLVPGAKPIADGNEHTALRVFTKENIDETGTPPVAGKGYGDAYLEGYEQLWSGE